MNETIENETTEGRVDDKKESVKISTPRRTWFRVEEIAFLVSIVANVATAAGIILLVFQLSQTNTIESRRVAIEAIRQTRSPEFLKAFRQAKLVSQTEEIDEKDKDALIDSVNHVMNVYDDIAVIYSNNIADKCMIKDSIYSAAKEWSEIVNKVSTYRSEDRKHFDLLLRLMDREYCN